MGFGRRLFGGMAGPMAGWIYATSILPVVMARMPIIDGVFSLFLTATWAGWWLGYDAESEQEKKELLYGCMGMHGLATMTKGIAAIALTGAIIFPFIFLRLDWKSLRNMFWIPGILLFAAIVLPWHIAAALREPQFLHFYIIVQHFQRLSYQEHASPFWFFPAILPFGLLFWTALFFPAVVKAFRQVLHAVKILPRSKRKKEVDVLLTVEGICKGKRPRQGAFSDHPDPCCSRAVQPEQRQTDPLYPSRLSSHGPAPFPLHCERGTQKPFHPLVRRNKAGLLVAVHSWILIRIQDTLPMEAARVPFHVALWGLGSGKRPPGFWRF